MVFQNKFFCIICGVVKRTCCTSCICLMSSAGSSITCLNVSVSFPAPTSFGSLKRFSSLRYASFVSSNSFYICKINDITIMVSLYGLLTLVIACNKLWSFNFRPKYRRFNLGASNPVRSILKTIRISTVILFLKSSIILSLVSLSSLSWSISPAQMTFHRSVFIKFCLNFIKIRKQLLACSLVYKWPYRRAY